MSALPCSLQHYHNSQDVETAKMSVDWWVDTESVMYVYNEILVGGGGDLVIYKNMDEPGRQYTNWNKAITERQILHDFIFLR